MRKTRPLHTPNPLLPVAPSPVLFDNSSFCTFHSARVCNPQLVMRRLWGNTPGRCASEIEVSLGANPTFRPTGPHVGSAPGARPAQWPPFERKSACSKRPSWPYVSPAPPGSPRARAVSDRTKCAMISGACLASTYTRALPIHASVHKTEVRPFGFHQAKH